MSDTARKQWRSNGVIAMVSGTTRGHLSTLKGQDYLMIKSYKRPLLQEQLGGLLYDFSLYTRPIDATGLDLPYHIYERILNEMEES